jgi:hypothetical protein
MEGTVRIWFTPQQSVGRLGAMAAAAPTAPARLISALGGGHCARSDSQVRLTQPVAPWRSSERRRDFVSQIAKSAFCRIAQSRSMRWTVPKLYIEKAMVPLPACS